MNRILLIVVIVIGLFIYSQNSKDHYASESRTNITEVIKCLRSHIGTTHSSKSSKGLDCSALVQKCYKNLDISLPRDSRSQFEMGKKISIENAKAGDLIFFLGSNLNSQAVGHSGIISSTDNKNIHFIHSTLSKGVIESKLSENYYKRRFKGIRRVLTD